jgi:hypothetical protein
MSRTSGTSAWRLDPKHALKRGYAVCTRNANHHSVEGKEDHHPLFWSARSETWCRPLMVRGATSSSSVNTRVNIADVLKGDRNPVKYAVMEDLGINPSKLKWEPMPARDEATAVPGTSRRTKKANGIGALTMAEAKKAAMRQGQS